MEELIALVLKSYGLVGFLILLPALGCFVLWTQNKELHKEVVSQTNLAVEAHKSRVADQAARVADTERMMQKIVEIVKEQSSLNANTNELLSRLGETVEKMERHIFFNR